MKKKYKNTDLSDQQCANTDPVTHQRCRAKLKMNALEANPNAELCYPCDCKKKGKPTSKQRKAVRARVRAAEAEKEASKQLEAGA